MLKVVTPAGQYVLVIIPKTGPPVLGKAEANQILAAFGSRPTRVSFVNLAGTTSPSIRLVGSGTYVRFEY
jgi:hypothetical protein